MMKQLYADAVFYPTLWWNMLLGRVLKIRNWWDEIDNDVILGAYPFPSDIEKLSELGVGAVVNTCHEYGGPIEQYQRFDIRQIHIPTTDFTHPKLEDIDAAVDFMCEQISDGRRVYVHCKAGRARSATVVSCWLIRARQMSAQEAQQTMLRARPHVNPRIAERPVVKEFESKYLNQMETKQKP